jgi:hypothetical protein
MTSTIGQDGDAGGAALHRLPQTTRKRRKDAAARASIVAALERQLAKDDKALIGNAGFRCYLKTIGGERFAIDPDKIEEEQGSTASSCCAPTPISTRSGADPQPTPKCSAKPLAQRGLSLPLKTIEDGFDLGRRQRSGRS